MRDFSLFSLALILALLSTATRGEDEKPAWQVASPNYSGSTSTVELTVDEGTWMSVDVSPDGQQIVFDLLGNIYRMPISGGAAEVVVGDHSWDIQPRFSPDGTHIVFTSDRGGGDNIWTLDLDTRKFTQISFENFRLLNNPSWSPDGQYIAARKHFTTSRSLGTGEIWLYHASGIEGAKGVQIVAKPSETYQKELGEPAFSPDGRVLYYTQNATPGDMFIYHQDSNGQVFHIKEVDLTSGATRIVAGGPGGAVRPTPSPDGSRLAYIKRIEGVSKLHIKSLDSGEDRVIPAALDPDMQETWAINGVYPNIAWLPDGSGLVYWAGGKIWRVNLADGEVRQIAFQIKDQRTLFSPPRARVDVAPERFRTKMIRFATRSPTANHIVFESLGKLWVKRGDDLPVRLTRDDGFEYSPVWSPDGKQVFFLNWQDSKLASLRSVSARGGKSRTLSQEPGHFDNLAISGDGSRLLLEKHKGSNLTSPHWGNHPGIYLADPKSGELTFVNKRGYSPHFGPDDRIYFNERKRSTSGRGSDDAQTKLFSMTLSGHDIREEASSTLARVILISPDGTYLAHQEGFDVHVTARPRTGQSISLHNKQQKTLPTRRLNDIGGLYMQWSADSQTVAWTVGPALVSASVTEAMKSEAIDRRSVDLSMEVTTAAPSGTTAITNARVITMNADREVLEGATILLTDNRITAVGSDIVIPASARVVDVAGKTVMPGMIDAHAHGPYGRGSVIPQQNYNALAHLALGVTTVHNPSSRAAQVFAAAEYQQAGIILAPRIFSTGEIVYGARSVSFAPVSNVDDALNHIRRLKAQGAVSIKNYNQPRREQRQMVIEAARQEGMLAVAEGGSLFQMDMNLIVDGSTGIEHNVPALNLYDDVIQLWQAADVGYTPTLVVVYGGLTSEDYYYAESEVWKHPILSHFVPADVLQPRSVRRIKAPERDFRDDDAAAAAKLLLEAGVIVNTGAHGQREGLATHWEMWSFARGGMSAMQVLSLATINPARYLGMDADLGSIEAGKLADLVILNSDPLEDIRQTDNISHVMLNGRLYRAADLTEEITGDAKLAPLWFNRAE